MDDLYFTKISLIITRNNVLEHFKSRSQIIRELIFLTFVQNNISQNMILLKTIN